MANTINFDELASTISKSLNEYEVEIDETIDKEIKDMATELKKDLENNTNINLGTSNKHYKKSFAIKKEKNTARNRGYIIYNKKYQLTHLLEYGHATKNGKRTRAFPHWQEADKKAQTVLQKILNKLGG